MCNTCVIHKWSRRVVTMLPWLVIPLIGLWALSQLLPPAFRFEITPARLACVFVLLFTLFWYEILMPQLSTWRMRKNARLRQRERFEAIELQKLRKTAARMCRNCLIPYRDQNPGCGRFMCSYCGHISKRPVLDLPVPPGLGISNSRIIKDLVGKGGKILNGKKWSDNGWMCGHDWIENGNRVGVSFGGKSSYWRKNGNGVFGGEEHCSAEKSYSGIFIFACKLLTHIFLSFRWLWRKIYRVSTSIDASQDVERIGLAKRGENGVNFHESRGEKARRKAEEKRLARLEKELLEEEDRKQREEVARLVEERRKLRDEKMEAENRSKGSLLVGEREIKKEAEKKPRERRREKDKGSSKSNSDVEELEKKPAKQSERKWDGDKNIEIDRRENQRYGTEILKGQSMEMGYGMKNISLSSLSRGNAGSRYLDRMRGTFFSSSKAISNSGFFGRGANDVATIMKENKPNSSVDHTHISAQRRNFCPPELVAAPSKMSADHNIKGPVLTEPQSRTEPKKSWQQLFTRSSSVPPSSNANVISRPNTKFQAEVQSSQLCSQSSTQSFDNPINFGLPSPFILSTNPNGSTTSHLGFSPTVESMFPRVGEGPCEYIPEEPELFEDPCYVPDPISLLGPVSESLDNFRLDLGTNFVRDRGLELPHALKNVSTFTEANRPSPIESPLSRLREERHSSSNQFPSSPRGQDTHTLAVEDVDANNKGTWQMWNTSPLGHDGLGLVGGSPSWILSSEMNRSNREDFVHPSSQKTMASLFTQEDKVLPSTNSPQKVFYSSPQNGGTFSPVSGSSDHDLWFQRQSTLFPPVSGSENHFSLKSQGETTQTEKMYGSPNSSAINHPFEPSTVNCWSKKDWAVQSSAEAIGKPALARPHIGGLYPTPDVQSLWSFD